MLENLWLGLGVPVGELTVWQMGLRAFVVYVVALVLVRLGPPRLLAGPSTFDIVMGFILGSVVSRAINGQAPVFLTLVASVVLVSIHWLFAVLGYYWHGFGLLVKGRERVLLEDGCIRWDTMRATTTSERDLLEALHHYALLGSLERVQIARLERSGQISFVLREREPRVVEVTVQPGVQTVRIELT